MKVLLLSYYYPPDKAVGGQRARKVVEALRAAGHEVTVIAAGDPESESEGAARVRPLPSIRNLYARLKSRSPEIGNAGSSGGDPEVKTSGVQSEDVPRWKRWIFSFIWLPDDRQGYVLPAVWRAMRDPAGRPDLIYTTAPPFSVHLAGLLLKGLTGTRWVAEFRDPWTANPWKQGFMRSALSDWAEVHLERLCLGQADLVVPVSEGIADRIRDRNPESAIVIVRNGIDQLDRIATETAVDRSGPFEIMYTGSFYHSRSPFPFLDAIAQLVATGTIDKADLVVRFIGTKETFDGVSIIEFLRERGLADVVRLEAWMERDACLQQMRSADALFLLATDQPDQVPSKLYDYLGTRRPILAVADSHGESARMLRQSGGHVIVTENDTPAIKAAIEEILRLPVMAVGDLDLLNEWTSESQMANLMAAVGRLLMG